MWIFFFHKKANTSRFFLKLFSLNTTQYNFFIKLIHGGENEGL